MMGTITLKPGEAHRRISVLLNAVEITLTLDQAGRLKRRLSECCHLYVVPSGWLVRSSITGRVIAKGDTAEELTQWVDKTH